jgi:alpha-N-arabinofuranosidase
MRVDVAIGATGSAGFSNEGFAGMNITPASRYTASFYLRGIYTGRIDCTFWSNTTNKPLGSTTFTVSQTEYDSWVFYESTFTTIISPAAPDENNTFHVTFDATSTAGRSLHFHMISVFPQTYKNSKNGLRVDLAEGINAISGKFLRFPGGNNMEGPNAPYRWIWDKTIGPVINRPGFPGTWGYFNTDGLGLLEMMQVSVNYAVNSFGVLTCYLSSGVLI